MFLRKIVAGEFQANCYIIADKKGGKGVIVDAGGDGRMIMDLVKKNNLKILYIIATHAHIDHIAEVGRIKESTGANFLLHSLDLPLLKDPDLNLSSFMQIPYTFPSPQSLLQEGQRLKAGEVELQVLHTPGHTPGSICLKMDEFILTGDALFAGGVGRVDLPGGDFEALQNSIRDKIFSLPDEICVLPGHGPETTVGKEKKDNPFV